MALRETSPIDTGDQLLASPDTEGDIRTGGTDMVYATHPSDFHDCERPTPEEMFQARNRTSDRMPIRLVVPKPTDPTHPLYTVLLEDWHQYNPEGIVARQLLHGEVQTLE